MIKKYIAMLMIVLLFATTTVASFAQCESNFSREEKSLLSAEKIDSVSTKAFTEEEKVSIVEKFTLLEEYNYGGMTLTQINEVNEDYVFGLSSDDLNTFITVNEDSEGNVIFNITEGTKHDILVISADGSIFLDGKEVGIEEGYVLDYASADLGVTQRAFTYYWQNECPYGSSGNYTYPAGAYQNNNITLEKKIREITRWALVAILVQAFTHSMGPVGIVSSNFLVDVATRAINEAEAQQSYSKAFMSI